MQEARAGDPVPQATRDATSRAQVVAQVASHFMSLPPEEYDEGIHEALRALGTFAGADRAYAFRFHSDGGMSNTHEWCAPGITAEVRNLQHLPAGTFPWIERRLAAGEHVIVPRVEDLPAEASAERCEFERENIRSLLCVPLVSAGRTLGFIGFDGVRCEHDWSEDTVELLQAVGGIVAGALDHRRLRAELLESRAHLARAEDAAGIGLWSWDVRSGTVTCSRQGLVLLGLASGTCAGGFEQTFAHVHAEDAARVRAAIDLALTEQQGVPVTFRVTRGKGAVRWVRCETDVFVDARGRPERMVGMLQDISERLASEESRRRLSTAVEQVADAVLITDAEGVIRYVNPAFEAATGHARTELVGRDRRFLRHERQDPDLFETISEAAARGETWAGRLHVRRGDGSALLMDATVSPVQSTEGRILDHVAVLRDVTREAELEQHLRHGQKMEAVGMLAGGIAHDFNNLLIAIIGHSELLLTKYPDNDDLRRHAEEIRKAGDRAKGLTSQLLAFSRKQVLRPRALDLGAVIDDLGHLLRRVIGEDVRLEIGLPEAPAVVRADPGQMEQVVLNLATNARDAMPAGGTLRIEVGLVSAKAAALESVFDATARDFAVLAVMDTGLGMDESTQARIFEPFFTTKDKSHGTGLGLSTVYGIVRQSGGAIRVRSAVGQGTSFRVFLPRVDAAPDGVPEPPPARDGRGHEVVLVVEDDTAVAGIVRSTLRSHGYEVLYAENGRRALDLLEDRGKPIDLLFTDVVMPEMGGVQLAAELTARQPGLRVLYSSGYTDSALLRRGQLVEGVRLLQKPYSPSVLVHRVRETLDAPQAS